MTRMGFDPTTLVFERERTGYALDREVAAVGKYVS
jgi:hypothetical protein